MTNSVDPDQTAPDLGPSFLLLYLNLSVIIGKYLEQMTSADVIFRCIFLGALRANALAFETTGYRQKICDCISCNILLAIVLHHLLCHISLDDLQLYVACMQHSNLGQNKYFESTVKPVFSGHSKIDKI